MGFLCHVFLRRLVFAPVFRLVVIFLLLGHVALGHVTPRVAGVSTANLTRGGTLTLAGNTPAPTLSVTVNGLAAQTNGDFTFAATNLALADGANSFTNIAANAYGVRVTNIVRVNLPASPVLRYNSNGNLTNDGTRSFTYDAQEQLTAITVTNAATGGSAKTEFVYDGLGRRRIQRDYAWSGGSFSKTNDVRFIYDGDLLVQVA
jgi:YD repeat-containing protein